MSVCPKGYGEMIDQTGQDVLPVFTMFCRAMPTGGNPNK